MLLIRQIVDVLIDVPFPQSECEQKGESYWYSVTASVVTRIVENIEVKYHIPLGHVIAIHLTCVRIRTDFSLWGTSSAKDTRCPLAI